MKAQRRHELKENELAKAIKKAPTAWQQSGGKFLALLIGVLVVVILVRYKLSSNRNAQAQAVDLIAQAREGINQLQESMMMGLLSDPQQTATDRRRQYNDANAAIIQAMSLSDNHQVQAEALVARGALNWTAANLPELPGSTTQPSLMLKDPADALKMSAEAYQTVLNSYTDEPYSVIAARFGLAGIDENRGDFDAARAQYQALDAMTAKFPGYQQIVNERLKRLSTLKNKVIIGQPTTAPATESAATRPATAPIPVGILAPSALKAATAPATQKTKP